MKDELRTHPEIGRRAAPEDRRRPRARGAQGLRAGTSHRAVDQDIAKAVEQDLRTARTRSFLDGASKVDGGRRAALLDRSAVDVLGIAGAAQVLARRLATDPL